MRRGGSEELKGVGAVREDKLLNSRITSYS